MRIPRQTVEIPCSHAGQSSRIPDRWTYCLLGTAAVTVSEQDRFQLVNGAA